MTFSEHPLLQELLQLDHEIIDLSGTLSLLAWDQDVMMPEKGVELRAHQLSTLASVLHDRQTNGRIGELLDELEIEVEKGVDQFSDLDRGYLRHLRREYDQATKLPRKLVRDLTEAVSRATPNWERAREEDDFSLFQDNLQEVFDLTLQKAEDLGYKQHPYDALLDLYEPEVTEKWLTEIFVPLRESTIELLGRIRESGRNLSDDILHGEFEVEKQLRFTEEVAAWMGFNFTAGRQDVSTHPFTSGIGGALDVRITTRARQDLLTYSLIPTIHETGHGVYDQNVHPNLLRTSVGGAISLGIHESQSRFYENMVGRSMSFWRYWFPRLRNYFPGLPEDALVDLYRAINVVRPSHIRTESDEVTYNLHVILRFEIERELVEGKIKVGDLPEIWRAKMEEYVGVVPPTDKEGVLQDVHWSHGFFGYFPTYTLGNLYAAQFQNKLRQDLDMDQLIEAGSFDPVRQWLSDQIHQWGAIYLPDELCLRVTGESLNSAYFIDYIQRKYGELYSL